MYVSTAGEKSRLLPLCKLDLEQAIECINDHECMEVTLPHRHVRQRILVANTCQKRQE